MPFYCLKIEVPQIGMEEQTVFFMSDPILVRADSLEEAREKIEPHLSPRDPKVMKALMDQDGRSEGEYFTLYSIAVSEEGDVILLPTSKLKKQGYF